MKTVSEQLEEQRKDLMKVLIEIRKRITDEVAIQKNLKNVIRISHTKDRQVLVSRAQAEIPDRACLISALCDILHAFMGHKANHHVPRTDPVRLMRYNYHFRYIMAEFTVDLDDFEKFLTEHQSRSNRTSS